MKRLYALIAAVLFLVSLLEGVALAANRSVPARSFSTITMDGVTALPGDTADLRKALQEASVVHYRLVIIDDVGDEDREAYLDRLLDRWGWPAANTLLLVVFTKGNFDIRFAMGSDFRKSGVSVAEMVALIHGVYLPEVRTGDPARAMAKFIRSVNGRMNPKEAFAPDQVVQGFYDWHVGAFSDTDTQISLNTLAHRTYRTSPYVTPDYIKRMDALLDGFEKNGGGYDPIFCMQNHPYQLWVGKATIDGNIATVPVAIRTDEVMTRTVSVSLKQIDGAWRIDQMTCPVR